MLLVSSFYFQKTFFLANVKRLKGKYARHASSVKGVVEEKEKCSRCWSVSNESCKTSIESCCHVNNGYIKSIPKIYGGAFYFSLLDLCCLKLFPKLPGPYVSGFVPVLFETKNIYMEIINMFQNLLTVVKRWHLFSTDEFIPLQTKDQCYFAFSEFGTETTLTGKCMHVNEDSYLEWWKSTLTVSNFKNCF